MNAAQSVPLFAGMLTMRPWDEVTRCVVGAGVQTDAFRGAATVCEGVQACTLAILASWLPVSSKTCRPAAGHLMLPSTEDAREKIRASAAEYAQQISGLLQRMPREMLLLLKTNDCLRTIDTCLGQARKSAWPAWGRMCIIWS